MNFTRHDWAILETIQITITKPKIANVGYLCNEIQITKTWSIPDYEFLTFFLFCNTYGSLIFQDFSKIISFHSRNWRWRRRRWRNKKFTIFHDHWLDSPVAVTTSTSTRLPAFLVRCFYPTILCLSHSPFISLFSQNSGSCSPCCSCAMCCVKIVLPTTETKMYDLLSVCFQYFRIFSYDSHCAYTSRARVYSRFYSHVYVADHYVLQFEGALFENKISDHFSCYLNICIHNFIFLQDVKAES